MKTRYFSKPNFFLGVLLTLLLSGGLRAQDTARAYVPTKVMQSSFSKEKIFKLIDPSLAPLCAGCKLAGVAFVIDYYTNPPSKTNIEYIEAFRAEWDGGDSVHLDSIYPAGGGNLKKVGVLPRAFNDNNQFVFVFFTAEELLKLADYSFSDNQHKSQGIILERFVHDAGTKQFQTLKANTDPKPYNDDGSVAAGFSQKDVTATQIDGASCPPVWNNQHPTILPDKLNDKNSGLLLVRNGQRLTTDMILKALKRQIKGLQAPGPPRLKKPVVSLVSKRKEHK